MKKYYVLLLAVLPMGVFAQLNTATPLVKTANGIVEGISDAGIDIFRGIPFARPPIGDLRWKEPQPVQNWEGVYKADKFGPKTMQRAIYGDMGFRADTMSEDCLYLNVWTPAKSADEKLPVLVYFYGGGYRAGDGSEPRYDGESMARKGIVSVTVNYRLGVFGFFAYPELSKETSYKGSGNYGLMDQTSALRWVQQNIAAFGGDPKQVTIAGESCGSRSVCAQMASPLAKGLFARAIGESGALMNSTIIPVTLAEAEQMGIKFANQIKAKSLDELRAMPAWQLLEATADPETPYPVPNVDNYFLPMLPIDIFKAGEQSHVPLLVGWNSEEMNYKSVLGTDAPTIENFVKALTRFYGSNVNEVLELYKATTEEEVLQAASDLAGDRFAGFNTWKWFDLHRQTGNGSVVYRYFYSRPRPAMRTEMGDAQAGFAGGVVQGSGTTKTPPAKGAVHSAEIEYALGNLPTNRVYDWQPEDYRVSAIMQEYFANFIKTGNPNGIGLPFWPTANKNKDQLMHIDADTRAEIDPHAARYQWLDKLPADPSK